MTAPPGSARKSSRTAGGAPVSEKARETEIERILRGDGLYASLLHRLAKEKTKSRRGGRGVDD